jgi:multimeric flavodoxin WrbA
MALRVLGISTSPRVEGNSDLLLKQALAGAESQGGQVEYLHLRDFDISPCVECNFCFSSGKCRIEDDYQLLSAKMLEADRMIFATPIFFMSVCSQAKVLIDRCQCLWARKYVLKEPIIEATGRDRRAMVIAVGGTKGKKMFECIRMTMKYYLDVLEMRYCMNLFVNKVDERGEIQQRPEALEEAYRLGGLLVSATEPPDKTIDVELT